MKTYAQDLLDISKCKAIIWEILEAENKSFNSGYLLYGLEAVSHGNIGIIRIGIYISKDLKSRLNVPSREISLWFAHKFDITEDESRTFARYPRLFSNTFKKHGFAVKDCTWCPAPEIQSGGYPSIDYLQLEIDCATKHGALSTNPLALEHLANPSLKEIQIAINHFPDEALNIILQRNDIFQLVVNNSKLMKETFRSLKKKRGS